MSFQVFVSGLMAVIISVCAFAADTGPPDGAALVHADGSVSGVIGAWISPAAEAGKRRQMRYDFGLPQAQPVRRWLEEDKLPICHTQWEKNGIRYTQTVLETRLEPGDLMPGGKAANDRVLLVQLTGENNTNEYTEAAATFAVQAGGWMLNLELRDGMVFVTETNTAAHLAVIDVPATGLGSTKGPQLQFHGNMPPGTSGAMTIKIPAAKLSGEEALKRLRDLEFAEELRRVKRFWAEHLTSGYTTAPPVAFQKTPRD